MFTYNLSIAFFNDKTLIRPIVIYRYLLVFVAAMLTAALFVNGFSFPLLCLDIICAFSALYEETWLFDQSRKILRYRNGLIFLALTKTMNFDEIDHLEVEVFVRGSSSGKEPTKGRLGFGQSRMRRYSIVLKNGTIMVIEIKKLLETDPFLTSFEKLASVHSLSITKK